MTFKCYKGNTKGLKGTGIKILSFFLVLLFLSPWLSYSKQAEEKEDIEILTGPVFEIKIDFAISPASLEILRHGLNEAKRAHASLFIILLDTPGGLVTSLRKMVQEVMSAPFPVCVFVYPPGAQAASAGALLTMSADIAAMAPGTNIGAAHPVGLTGDMAENGTMAKKMENDLAALAIGIAKRRGRNAKWAEDAVRKSVSISAQMALKLGVIDLIARDVPELLERLRGKRITLLSEKQVEISPKGIFVKRVKPTLREKILKIISDPNIAYILMMIGLVGLYFELAHPGVILPGTVGAISLMLALYALHTLSANITGILLILFAFVLFVLELFITSHGVLAISGAVALAIGSLMLFENASGIFISARVLWPTIVFVLAFFLTIALLAARAIFSKPKTGLEGLVGKRGEVKKKISRNEYLVFVHGELWRARSKIPLRPKDEVKVTEIEGLRLKVKPIKKSEEE